MTISKHHHVRLWLAKHNVADTKVARLATGDHASVKKLRQGVITAKCLDKLYEWVMDHPNGLSDDD